MPFPLDVPETELRRRRSQKWVAYPADVLPLFVAETDVLLAPAIRAGGVAVHPGLGGAAGQRCRAVTPPYFLTILLSAPSRAGGSPPPAVPSPTAFP